ncbi:MAG: phosphotransferase, partial [Bacteroidia bacterium]|nr:phosphotransferase [Bacteroidia bacterium]
MALPAETPKAEIEINDALVRQLIHDQHPDFSHLSILRFEEGWDNVLYRLGNQYVIRLPRRQIGAELIQNEITWLPMVAQDVQYATPQPVRIGQPQREYPWSWVIVPWIEGVSADLSPPQRYEVDGFVQFLKTIHQPAPDEAPENATRGISLSAKAKDIGSRM